MKFVMIANLFSQAGTFVQLLDGEDSDEKAVTAMGILNTLETMLNVMEGSKEVHVCCNSAHMVAQSPEPLTRETGRPLPMPPTIIVLYCNSN